MPTSDEYMLNRVDFFNAREKMPLELTPIYYRLTRLQSPTAAPAPAPAE